MRIIQQYNNNLLKEFNMIKKSFLAGHTATSVVFVLNQLVTMLS